MRPASGEMYRLMAPLTAEEAVAVAQLVEMAAMKAWTERERTKGRPESDLTWANCMREIGLFRFSIYIEASVYFRLDSIEASCY